MSNQGTRSSREPLTTARGAILLVIVALCYYSMYWRSGLMLSGEEGVAAVIAQRLNAGERPIVDTFLGYNVGWFYPVAFLFKIAGPDYLLMRCWFFLLGLFAGLTAFATILRATSRTLVAMLGGLAVIVMPGVIGRNYMGLLGMLGMLGLLGVFILSPKRALTRFLWMIGTGISISLAWLVRIDLGFFQSILFILALLLLLLKPEAGLPKRIAHSAVALAILAGAFLSIQVPAYRDATIRGFGPQYTQQYWIWPIIIRDELKQVSMAFLESLHPIFSPSPVTSTHVAATATVSTSSLPPSVSLKESAAEKNSASYSNTSLKRPSLYDILRAQKFKDRIFALLIYLPLPVSLLFVIWGLSLVIRSFISKEASLWQRGGILLVSTGSALVLFPQYFFWRPDMVHLAEFMVPFMVTLIIGISLAVDGWKKTCGISRACFLFIIIAASLDLGAYLVKGWQTDGAGSIAASRRRHLEFSALHGIRVKLNPQELSLDTLLRDTILTHSKPGEFVVCYPYFPMVNFMTDRPSYEYNLYTDNALPKQQFFEQSKANIERHHPAVIVIGTGKVNDTESSRFTIWAAETYDYIRQHFRLVASVDDIEIYAR